MRLILPIVLSVFVSLSAVAQQIDYTIPEGYESRISQEDYKKIVDIAVSIINKRYTVESVKQGAIYLKKNGEISTLNLHNVITLCKTSNNKDEWKLLIEEHFSKLFSSIDEQKKINPADYESVRKYLSLRIYNLRAIRERGGEEALVLKTDLEGTGTVLMLDLPGAFVPVDKKMFLLWKRDSTEVFKVAQNNVNKQEIEKVTKLFPIDGNDIEISFIGNEDYAASYALDLMNNSPDMVGEWGTVVAIPNKGLVDLCKISRSKPLDFVKFIQSTKRLIEQAYIDHPQPISDQYFWYYKGQFTKISVLTNKDGTVSVISPFGLTELMTTKNNQN